MNFPYLPFLEFIARHDSGMILTPCLGASSEFDVIKARMSVKSAAAKHGGTLVPYANVSLRQLNHKDVVDLGTLDDTAFTRRKILIAVHRMTVATVASLTDDPATRLSDIARRLGLAHEISILFENEQVFAWNEREFVRQTMRKLLSGHLR